MTDSLARPLVTLVLFTYNQERYIEEAVASAFAQSYSPLEIILSDDCSSDHTFQKMQEMVGAYRGPNEIRLNRNDNNLGLIGHVNKMLRLAQGELILLCAGDDISLPQRAFHMVEQYVSLGKKEALLHGPAIRMDENGNAMDIWVPPVVEQGMTLNAIALSQALYIGATAAISKPLLERFGPIAYPNAYEDLVYGFRAAITDSLIYVPEPLVKYRYGVGVSSKNSSSVSLVCLLRSLRRKRLAYIDVLKQRMLDICTVPTMDLSVTKQLIQSELAVELLRIEMRKLNLFYLVRPMANTPAVVVKAALRELREVIGCCKNYIRNVMNSHIA